ncbi:hypothetical protein AgCh_012842 [Apium graveolens]
MAPKRQRTQVSSSTNDSSSVGCVRLRFATPEADYTRLLSKPIAKERDFDENCVASRQEDMSQVLSLHSAMTNRDLRLATRLLCLSRMKWKTLRRLVGLSSG